MSFDVTNNATSIIITADNGYSQTIYKDEVQVVKEAEDSYLRLKSSQSPYKDLAWWDATTIDALTGATDISDGFDLLTTYLSSNT